MDQRSISPDDLYDVTSEEAKRQFQWAAPQFVGLQWPNYEHKTLYYRRGMLSSRIERNGMRCYATNGIGGESNYYPSITTVLSHFKDAPQLDAWIQRVGEQEAERIRNKSAMRGSQMHKLCENYIRTFCENYGDREIKQYRLFDDVYRYGTEGIYLFKSLVPLLNRCSTIYGCEVMMASNKLKIGGTTDLLADFDGIPSVVDFKNARRVKSLTEVEDYFLQETAYAVMAYETFGFNAQQIVTMIAIENSMTPQLFVEPITKERILKVRNMGHEFYEKHFQEYR